MAEIRKKRRKENTMKKDMQMLLRQPLLLLVILLIFAALFIFIILPVFNVFARGLVDEDGRLTLKYFLKVVGSAGYMNTFKNSILLGVIVAFFSTLIGYVFAYALSRTEMRGKKLFRMMATLPIISPPFVLSLAIIFLFGRQGIITRGIFGIKDFNVYGLHSLILVQTISNFPIAYLTLSGILESIDPSVEDAAYNMGASRGHIFRTVTLPLSMPGIVSAFLLTFIQSMEDFSNPAVIAGNFSTLSVEAYRIITGMFDLRTGSMMAVVLLLPTLCAYLLQKYWIKNKSFVTVTGKPTQARKGLEEKYIVIPLTIFCALVCGVIILFYGTVFAGAFVRTWGVDFSLTMKHFQYVFSMGATPLKNSVLLACIAAPLGGFVGMVIAYLTVRKRFIGKWFMELASVLTFAIPGTVLGIGYVSTFNQKPLLLTGTAFVLIASFMFRNMPVAIESGTTTLLQIDKSIDEASTILGASNNATFLRVTLPLLKQPFFAGIVYAFVRSITAISSIIFLVSPRWSLATTSVFSLFESSRYGDASAYILLMIVIILVAIVVIDSLIQFLLNPRSRKQKAKERVVSHGSIA